MARSLSTIHFPTLIGVLILGIGLVGGVILVNTQTTNTFLPRASPQTTPKDLKITNLTQKSLSVSWKTDSATIGFVQYGTSPNALSLTATEDQDFFAGESEDRQYTTHHVTLRNLNPDTTYYFKVGTGSNELYDDAGQPYSAKTASQLTGTGSTETISGSVLHTDETPAAGALVYISSDVSGPLSAVTQQTGNFAISLSDARSKDGITFTQFDDTTVLTVLTVGPNGTQTSTVTVRFEDALPIAPIILGINQDLTADAPNATPAPVEDSLFSALALGSPTEVASASASASPSPSPEATEEPTESPTPEPTTETELIAFSQTSDVTYPSTESGELVSGSTEQTLLMIAGGLLLVGVGFLSAQNWDKT